MFPRIEKVLSRVLKNELGDIDLKKTSLLLAKQTFQKNSKGFENKVENERRIELAQLFQNAELGGVGSKINTVA